MSPLWKLKYDLFLTEERKKYCHIAANNRCQACLKLDSTGHFLMCTKSKTHKINAKFIDHYREIDPGLSAEKLIHMDISGSKDDVYAIGWCLAILKEENYCKKKDPNLNKTMTIKISLSHNLKTFNFLKNQQYTNTLNLIESLINS